MVLTGWSPRHKTSFIPSFNHFLLTPVFHREPAHLPRPEAAADVKHVCEPAVIEKGVARLRREAAAAQEAQAKARLWSGRLPASLAIVGVPVRWQRSREAHGTGGASVIGRSAASGRRARTMRERLDDPKSPARTGRRQCDSRKRPQRQSSNPDAASPVKGAALRRTPRRSCFRAGRGVRAHRAEASGASGCASFAPRCSRGCRRRCTSRGCACSAQ